MDANQTGIVRALRAAGCLVCSVASLGDKAPGDLLVWSPFTDRVHILEVKRPDLQTHAPQNLAEKVRLEDQQRWRDKGWPVDVVYSDEGALLAVGAKLAGR